MKNINVGDIVARKSYNHDILFRVTEIIEGPNNEKNYILKGIDLRLVADSPESDLDVVPDEMISQFSKSLNKKINNMVRNILKERNHKLNNDFTRNFPESKRNNLSFGRPGKVLHLDGEKDYLEVCEKAYKELKINAVVKIVAEAEQPKLVGELLREHNPDILVLTGHDSLLKGRRNFSNIQSYRNSKYFIEAVKEARKYEPNIDDLVIFAGACQSLYEALIDAGANFASSPHRVLAECRV